MEIAETADDDSVMRIREEEQDEDQLSYNKKFPSELREEMIARVASVTHLFRMRLVCKAWNAIIASPDLAQLHAARHHHEAPWLLVARCNYTQRPLNAAHATIYTEKPVLHLVCDPCTTMQQWIAPPLPFLAAYSCDLSTCQSHGGLVCCLASTQPSRSSNTVLIFNPVTRAYKLLPSPSSNYGCGGMWSSTTPRRNYVLQHEEELASDADVDVALWSRGGHFKVGICDTTTRQVRVFDSSRGYWRDGSRPPDRLKPRFRGFRDSTNQDTLYWYDVEVDTWFQTSLPAPAAPCTVLRWPSVFKDGASATLMLAAVLLRLPCTTIHDAPAPAPAPPPHHAAASAVRRVVGFGVWASRGGEWVQTASTPAGLGLLHRLQDSKLMCHPKYVCMTGLLRFSLWPWNCFYPRILSLQAQRHQAPTWQWSSQPLGPKTWAHFRLLSLLDPALVGVHY